MGGGMSDRARREAVAHSVGDARVHRTPLALRGQAPDDFHRMPADAIDDALREHRAEAAGATAWRAVTR
jgi:hypothetical protein